MLDTPGVYVREIPSGSRPIAGVSTSNTAIIGTFSRGSMNEATRVTSFGEFERVFGGLHVLSESSYAVRSYFLNGGSVMFVVRVGSGGFGFADLTINDLDMLSSSEGDWGNGLRVGIAHTGATTFTMLVREYDGATIMREEVFIDLSVVDGNPRFVDDVISEESELITASHGAANLPTETLAGGLDALLEADENTLTPFVNGDDGIMEGDVTWTGNVAQNAIEGAELTSTGIHALNTITPQVFNLMVLPAAAAFDDDNAVSAAIYQTAYVFCRRNFAFLIVDPPGNVDRANMAGWQTELSAAAGPNSALYYPRVTGPDPLNAVAPRVIGPSGMVAGICARTDTQIGVWKAPAGTGAALVGATPVDVMTDRQQGPLNSAGVNALRTFPVYNSVVWGARTLDGADARASEWRYVPVRRLALFIENSLQRGV